MAVSLNPRLRLRFVRTIVTTLFLSLFATFPVVTPLQSASASTTITKTVTIKGSNNVAYSGAVVSIIYYVDGDLEETKKPLQTTGSNGQVTISYPANAGYAQMFITPPVTDTTHAVQTIDLLTSSDAAITNVTLKTSNIRVDVKRPDGTSAGINTCVDYPKQASSRWVTTQYRTTRSGAFGIAIPSTLNSARDYHIAINPCNVDDYKYLGINYGLRRASNGTITLYTNDNFTTIATASGGVYTLTFEQGLIRGSLLGSDGNPISLTPGTYARAVAVPIFSNGSTDWNRNQMWSDQTTTDGKFAFNSTPQPGIYSVGIRFYGLDPLPSFTAGRFWVNESKNFSLTETGTYTSTLDLVYTVPNTGLTKFKFVDSAGNYDQYGGQISYAAADGFKNSPLDLNSDSTGVASARIPDGTYAFWTTPRNSIGLQDNYTLAVLNGAATLRNAAGTQVNKVGDYFPLQAKTPSLRFRIVSPTDSITSLIGANATFYTADFNDWLGSAYIETNTAIIRLKAEPGSYALEVNPNRPMADLVSTNFTIDIDSVSVVVKNGTTVINPVNGIYNLAAKRPMLIGEVLNPAGTESVRFAEVRAIHTTNQKWNTYEQSNSAGLFGLNLPADGTYQISAIPPLGVNANFGISDSVTVTVTNGLPSLAAINIRLRTANISGVVTGPTGIGSPQNWLSVSESRTGAYLEPTFDGPLTDEDGGYSLYLPSGAYGITPSSDYGNTGGVATGPKNCVVSSNPSTVTTCNVPLTAPNVTGTVTIGGEKPAQSSVGFRAISGKPSWSGWSDINNYGINLESGTYRMLIGYQLYNNGYTENVIPGPICSVPASGSVTCNATMPATNLNIQVANWTGSAVSGNMIASISQKEGSQYFAICCSWSDQSLRDGKIKVGLLPGSYKITINDEEGLSNGSAQTYFFNVTEGGSVSNMSLTESGTVIDAVNGIYSLALKEPAVTGTIYGLDGTTPEPYIRVNLYSSNGNNINSASSDRLGRFAFEFEETLANGTYYLMAEVVNSPTKGNSKIESFTVLNGKATGTVSLKLNVPNVLGVASGPLRTSPNSYIRVSSSTNSFLSGKGAYTYTDSSGKFAFYLPSGTYTFYGETDFDITGGISGSSSACTVNAETTTVCNLTFAAPNVTGSLSIAGVTSNSAHVLFFPAYGIADNPAVNSYGWIYAPSGKYGIQANPGTYRTFLLSYNSSLQGKGQLIIPGPLCTVPTTGSVICNVALPTTNFTFRTKSATNADLAGASRFTVEIKNGDQYQSAGSNYLSTPSSVALSLVNGSYRLRLDPASATSLEGTVAEYTFDVTSGAVVNLRRADSTTVLSPVSGLYNLPLVKPNVTGTVSGPKGAAADTYIEVLKVSAQGSVDGTKYWAQTNSQGKFALSLPVGVYILKSRPDFAATGGGDTAVRCEVISETNTSLVCDIQLTTPNVTGTVRVAGAIPEWGSVLFQPAKGVAGNTATEWYGWSSLVNGVYGFNAKPGTYRINVSGSASSNGNSIPAGLCVVPESGTATCNLNMPATNFVARVLDAQGSELSNAQINLSTSSGEGTCCNYLSGDTKRLSLNLLDGTYGLQVSPTDGKGGSQGYVLKIETGTVTSLKATGSNDELVASGGLYTLRLRPPTFSGTVYKSDGTTVAPLTQVEVRDVSGKWGTYVESDSSGKFIVDVPTSLNITRVNITAFANRFTYRQGVSIDKTLGRSATRSESITAGAGNQSISLTLRRATINGRVSGSKAALINNYISIQQLDGSGNWNWLDFNPYTDKNGDFAEYLPTGTYRLYSSGDSKGSGTTGGGETYGSPCTINADSATATVCNLALTPPNTTGLAKLNGANISWGQIQFAPDQGVSRDIPRRNYYLYIEQGNYSGNLQPDTYQTSIWFSLNGKYTRTFGPKCVVPETGTVTCDANLPAANLAYRVLDSNNVLQTTSVYSSLEIKSGNNWNSTCCSYPDETLRDGKFENTLINGDYRLIVRPNNSSVAGSSRAYTFTVESATVKNFSILGSTETISPVSGIYTTKLTPAAISGTIYKSNGTTGYANARVCMRPASTQNLWWRACTQSNESGKYTMDQSWVTDGVWEIQAFSSGGDLTEGSSLIDSITVTSGLGSKVGNLTLRTPNFTGVVSGPRGASPNNYISIRKYFDNGEYTWIDSYFQSDSQGRYAFTLEPGRYRAYANTDMAVAGGTSALSSECIVTAGNTTTCNISLIAPNVTGTVRIGGTAVSASVEFLKEINYGKEQVGSSGTDQNGNYALNVPAGTYRPRIYLYSSGNHILGPPCVVQANVNATCDINLPATNIRFKVNKALGGTITTGLYAGFTLKTQTIEIWAGSASNDGNGLFRGSLIDGTYRINLSPDGNDVTVGTSSVYSVTVESGTVTSFTLEGSTTQLVATAGVFTLSLNPPSIAGTVVAPDGTTPVPNSRVYAYTNPYSYDYTSSDKNAAFGFAKLPDGTYSVIAAPGWEDATKAQSAPQKVTITNGAGVSNLRLVLRTPNVSGVVRGPTSKVSIRNWLEVEQKMEGNWWKRPDYFTGVMTSPEGSFGFYLAPGVYRIRANGDLDQAGGVSTSRLCTVPETGTVSCDITLKSPNLKIRVVAPSGTTAEEGSYAWGYLQSAADESAILNRNPSFQWINGGNLETVLEDGTWIIRTEAGKNPLYSSTQFTVVVSQGLVTSVRNANDETVTATSGIYLLPLIGSNLTGSITFNGAPFEGSAAVQALRQDGEYFNYYNGKWTPSNQFGFTLPAGNYKIEVTPYSSNGNVSVSTTRSELCVVEATGTSTCNVALKSPNLKGKITDQFGAVARFTQAYVLMQQAGGERWVRWLELREGLFDTHLEDGTYRIQVMPYWEYRKTYTDRSYIIKVESGTVQSVTDLATLLSVSPSSGTYAFTLGTPSVTGKVYNPGSSTGAQYINIQVAPSSSPNYWRYSTQSDANGDFALTVPNGTYIIQAVPNNGGFQYGKSETRTITITNSALVGIDSVTLVLRQPNFTGRVVIPNTSTPLANVNVNINIDGEYAYGWTDSDGRFSAYIDNPAPACPSRCSVYLNYFKGSEYTPKYYSISAVGDVGDLAIGGVTSILTVLVPQSSGPALPSVSSWVTVEEVANDNSRSWVTSGNTNDLGRVGLSLTTGRKYIIWAYPNGEQSRSFAPKKLEITNYSPETHSVLSTTFALPNVKLKVVTSTGADNVYGWFTLSSWDSATSTATELSNGSLDSKGNGALTLDNGNYQLRFWPGKGARGVQKIVKIKVEGSTITTIDGFIVGSDSLTSGLLTAKLPSGNISGTILSASSVAVPSALIAAYRADDSTKFVTTSSDANGNYQLNLDLTYSWIVKSVDPVSNYSGSLNIASRSPSNDVLSSQNVSLSTAPAS